MHALWVKHALVWTTRFPWLIAVGESCKVKSLGRTICCNAQLSLNLSSNSLVHAAVEATALEHQAPPPRKSVNKG